MWSPLSCHFCLHKISFFIPSLSIYVCPLLWWALPFPPLALINSEVSMPAEHPFWAHQESGCYADPALPCMWPLTMALHFYGRPGFLLYTPPGCGHTTLQPLQTVSAQPTSVLPLALSSKAKFHHPGPMRTSGCTSQAGECRVVVWTICAGLCLFCLQQTGWCPLLQVFEAPFLSQPISPPVRGLPRVQEHFLFQSSLPGLQVPFCFLFFFFHST